MIGIEIGDSVEGEQLDITTRKLNAIRPSRNDKLDKVVYGFRLQIKGQCVITTELNPKKFRINENSMLNKGDQIRGDRIVGFSQKAFKSKVRGGVTGTHKANSIIAKRFGFAKIEISCREHLENKSKLSSQKKLVQKAG